MALGPRLGNAPTHGIIPSMGWGGCWAAHGAEELLVALWCSFAHLQSTVSAVSCIPSGSP